MATYILRDVPKGLVRRAKAGVRTLHAGSLDDCLREVIAKFASRSPEPCAHTFGERYDIQRDVNCCAGCGAVVTGQVFELGAPPATNARH